MDKTSLQAFGLKATIPRMRVFKLLTQSKQQHLSAEAIHLHIKALGEEISLATVYRVLSQFELAGIVIRHRFEDGYSVYELDEGEHHDHLVCIKCRNVVEFVNPVIEQQQQAIAKQQGFQMTDHTLTIFGVCSSCQKVDEA